MNARIIDHDEAVKDLMAERYLLGELNATERDAYEEHLFCCDACFQQVKAGTELIGELRRIEAEGPHVPLAPGFMSRLLTTASQPVTITVFALLLFATGVAVRQGSIISRL
jgi:anti-sigma factor RsiW